MTSDSTGGAAPDRSCDLALENALRFPRFFAF